ncbi:MAG: SLBB domain-containing protein [Methanomicrobiales archaeon]|nr:SLBB domain-containing protein [Methanomicrobiales archaeon]
MTILFPPRWVAFLPLFAAVTAGAQTQQPAARFNVGDRILLRVEGEAQLSDTFTVGPGPALTFPVLGVVSLADVPRSAVEPYLTGQLSRFIKHPVVHARALIRVSVLGEVARPGYYAVPTDLVLADALMVAGGPTRDANMEGVRVERAGERLSPAVTRQALARGATLDDLSLHSGDGIDVPRTPRHDTEGTVRTLAILLTIPATIFGLTRVF